MTDQVVLQFRLGKRPLGPSEWLHRLMSQGGLEEVHLPHLRLFCGEQAFSIIAADPEGNEILNQRIGPIATVVCNETGPVPIERLIKQLSVREDELWWNFVTPRLCVAKKEPHWTQMAAPILDEDARVILKTKIERDLVTQARNWGIVLPDEPIVGFFDLGEPMPIPAICAERSGNGHPRYVLARKNVRMISNLRFAGDWAVGTLSSLGFGRLFRNNYCPDADLPAQCVLELTESYA